MADEHRTLSGLQPIPRSEIDFPVATETLRFSYVLVISIIFGTDFSGLYGYNEKLNRLSFLSTTCVLSAETVRILAMLQRSTLINLQIIRMLYICR